MNYSDTRREAQSQAWVIRTLHTLHFIPVIITGAVAYLLVYLARRVRRWYVTSRAQSWSKVNATVTGSYEIDEGVLFVGGWPMKEDDEYYPRYAVALEYSYRAGGEFHAGVYFLPETYSEGDAASDAERSWAGRKIVVRYNPDKLAQSVFLQEDGAPGKPHIPRLISYQPYVTDLSLK